MTFKGPEIFTPSKPTQITWIELGDAPPTGDPNGDVAPPKPVEEVQPSPKDVPEKVSAEKPEEEEIEKPKLPAKLAEPSSSSQSAAAEPTNTMPVDVYGAGTLALGAKTHGDGGGLDGDLSAAIGQAIANQISACWEAPKVALPNDLSIIMTVAFDRAGVLVGDPIVARLIQEEQKIVTQPDAFELAAMDAVKRCTPIRLPPGLYPYWSKIDVTIFSSVVPETRPGPQTQS